MAKNAARPLNNNVAIEDFLVNCVGLKKAVVGAQKKFELSDISRLVRDAENSVAGVANMTTLNSDSCRDTRYRSERDRQDLRNLIVTELCTLPRLQNDEAICLGSGGALPSSGIVRNERNAYLVTGLPASGKSTLVNRIADDLGAIIVDSDYAKRKIPEFQGPAGAQLVHEESTIIAQGGEGSDDEETPSLLGYCKALGYNIVMPKIGHDPQSLIKLRDALIKSEYKVHLTMVELPRADATLRAVNRFLNTERYVPLSRIYDIYANDPALTYYRFRVNSMANKDGWHSFGALSSENFSYRVLDCSDKVNPAALFKDPL